MIRLGITRSEERLKNLIKKAASRDVRIIPLPVTRTTSVDFVFPKGLSPDKIDWLFFTSRNGFDAFFDRIEKTGMKISDNTKIAVVGEKTAEAVTTRGYKPDFIPSQAYGDTLFNEFINKYASEKITVAYASAEDIVFDPTVLFEKNNISFYRLICYRSEAISLPKDIVTQFEVTDGILFTAPSTVKAFSSMFGKPRVKLFAIGQTTAHQMTEFHWPEPRVMNKPDVDQILEYI